MNPCDLIRSPREQKHMNYPWLIQAKLHFNAFCSFINKTTLFAVWVAKHLKQTYCQHQVCLSLPHSHRSTAKLLIWYTDSWAINTERIFASGMWGFIFMHTYSKKGGLEAHVAWQTMKAVTHIYPWYETVIPHTSQPLFSNSVWSLIHSQVFKKPTMINPREKLSPRDSYS